MNRICNQISRHREICCDRINCWQNGIQCTIFTPHIRVFSVCSLGTSLALVMSSMKKEFGYDGKREGATMRTRESVSFIAVMTSPVSAEFQIVCVVEPAHHDKRCSAKEFPVQLN
ncbi:hypothetical protein J6590_041885 [Homalodisca vitripennis]|nr:hypothetical protein J6590_041885 [Homalodisca vitripennis]